MSRSGEWQKMSRFLITLLLIINAGFAILFAACSAEAKAAKQGSKNAAPSTAKRIETTLVVDADTGKILYNINAHQRIYPASLTKLMTLYILFDEIKSHKMTLDQEIKISANAERMRPCKLGLKAGEKITVKDAILALIVKSANDVAVAVAEAVSGSENKFASKMNQTARKLGMYNSIFFNASGWHHPEQKTSAADLARLTLAIKRNFPEFYPWFKKDSFTFQGRVLKGHNRVTREYDGAEGMKTGYTFPAGFNLVSTASKNGKTLVAVVTGSATAAQRDKKMVKILDNHLKTGKNSNVFDVASAENKKNIPAKAKIAVKKNKAPKQVASKIIKQNTKLTFKKSPLTKSKSKIKKAKSKKILAV